MRIGLLRRYTTDLPAYLEKLGFASVQIEFCEGDLLDPATASDASVAAAVAEMRQRDIQVSAFAYYANLLEPDSSSAAEHRRRLCRIIQWASALDVPVIGIMAGRDPALPALENLPRFVDVFSPIVREAEDLQVRLAIENCPKFHAFPFRSTNFAFSFQTYDAIFAALPSPNLGLEYDPSHPVMMMMDVLEWVYRYGPRIFHVHAKDAEVVWREIRANGIYSDKAFRYRLPGFGDVDWGRLISALIEIGYRGALDIEGKHDPVYSGDLDAPGLVLARRHLEQYAPSTAAGVQTY